MTESDVKKLIGREIERAGSLRALAREWEVSPTQLSDIMNDRRGPGPKIFRHLGIVKAPVEFVEAPTPTR